MVYAKDNHSTLQNYEKFFKQTSKGKSLEKQIEKIIKEKELCKILDIGCGDCNALHELKEKFGLKIQTIGVDLYEPEKKPDTFILGDAIVEAFPIEIDIALCYRAGHEIGSIQKLIEKLMASLTVNGKGHFLIRGLKNKNGKLEFDEKMTEKDFDYLMNLSKEKNEKTSVETVFEEAVTPKGTVKYITGFKIVITG